MTATPDIDHDQAREFLTACMDRLAGIVGAVFNRRGRNSRTPTVAPISDEQWKSLYAVTEKMMEFVLSIRP